jgi:tetrahydromethanopterin S-methyltransferase subunit G
MNDNGRNQSATSAQRLQAHEVSMEEYNELAKRLDTMEASVGFVLNKVE